MSSSRDNWERLVAAVVKRQQIWELCHQQSFSTIASDDLSELTLSFSSTNSEPSSVPPSPLFPSKISSISQVKTTTIRNNASSQSVKRMLFSALYRRRKSKDNNFVDIPAEIPEVYLAQLKRFSLHELQVATDNFSNKNILGRGGFGMVYIGRLADGTLVAIKRLQKERTTDGVDRFQLEVEVSCIMPEHRNLLRLRGFCMNSKERFLIYPYMANGSLASSLEERQTNMPIPPLDIYGQPLDWWTRKRIALGSARGLSHLHDHCDRKIVYGDVKAENILLDEEYEAVVGDFSLAVLMDHSDTEETTAVRGTTGQIAPEYLETGKVSEKIDVFAYGVMLLELISGRRASDLARVANNDDAMLLDWVKGLIKKTELRRLVSPVLQRNFEEVYRLIMVALLCTQTSALGRPTMSEVVRLLDGEGLAERWDEWQKE